METISTHYGLGTLSVPENLASPHSTRPTLKPASYVAPAVLLMSLQPLAPALADTLFYGMEGSSIQQLQSELSQLGLLDQPPTAGFFGEETEQAVRDFQRAQGLTVDGIVGEATQAALESQSDAGAKPATKPMKGQARVTASPSHSETTRIQKSLQTFGYNPGPIDGVWGPKTEQAVRDFQRSRGLVADGIVGAKTWAALSNADSSPLDAAFESFSSQTSDSALPDFGNDYEILPVPAPPPPPIAA